MEIKYNMLLLKWYFLKNKNIISDQEKEKSFAYMTYAIAEDPYCFMRILLYIANTRKTDEQELTYKILIHFLGTMFADATMANLDLILSLGKKDDIIYFLQCPNIAKRISTFINHKSKEDPDYLILIDGKLINKKIERKVYYKPKFSKNSKWDLFLYKILDEPNFNGITL